MDNTTASAATPEPPSLDYLRTGRYHATTGDPAKPDDRDPYWADRLGDLITALSRPAPEFTTGVPDEDATPDDLAPADTLLSTDVWPSSGEVSRLLSCLRAFASSEGSIDLFAHFGSFPHRMYGRPALDWRPGETAASLEELKAIRARLGKDAPEAAEVTVGRARYRCELTGTWFSLPLGAPVPSLTLPLGDATYADPLALPPRSAAAPGEYEQALDATPHAFTLHPALVEAGPAYVLWAVWQKIDHDLFGLTEKLNDLLDLAAAFSGLEPEALTPDWPARAYRQWTRQRHDGGVKAWERGLVGVQPS